MNTGPKRIVIVKRPTALEALVAKHGSWEQAKFVLARGGQDTRALEVEHARYHAALALVASQAAKLSPRSAHLMRAQIPNFLFAPDDVVVCIGQDGLVANVAKYADGPHIIGINPDPESNLGCLVPFKPEEAGELMDASLANRAAVHEVALAELCLSNGQRLLAFNEIFVGPNGPASLRYQLSVGGKKERQSSSGLMVVTGAGSTGWWASAMAMARGMSQAFGGVGPQEGGSWAWSERRLGWLVREPYPGKALGVGLVAGSLGAQERLCIESHMEAGGQIFSDGMEADALAFDAGVVAEVGLAQQVARLVAA